MTTRIDILLATYNGELYLSDQIHSILKQTHPDIRLIMRDDGSTDSTRAIAEAFCHQFPKKIFLLPVDKNLGIKGNFSALMEHAEADYIMFSDQDDLWFPEKASKTLKIMKEIEGVDGRLVPALVHTDLVVTDNNLNTVSESYWKLSRLRPGRYTSLNRMLVQNNVTGCTMMINRQLLKVALTIPKECIMHDWWLALAAAAFGRIATVNEATMLYRQHGNNAIGAHLNKSIWAKLKDNDLTALLAGKLTRHQNEKILQALSFFQIYQESLNEHQKSLLHAYINWQKHSHFKKRYLIMKYGFFKNHALKNFIRLIFNIGL